MFPYQLEPVFLKEKKPDGDSANPKNVSSKGKPQSTKLQLLWSVNHVQEECLFPSGVNCGNMGSFHQRSIVLSVVSLTLPLLPTNFGQKNE
jgi:hypothetical protein